MTEQTTIHNLPEVCAALRRFSDGALALAAALEASAPHPARDEATREGLAADLFGEPRPNGRALSFTTGMPLMGTASNEKRRKAIIRAEQNGFNLRHWADRVRHLRSEIVGVSRDAFADMMGVTGSAVGNWETGMSFATRPNREYMERLAQGMAHWSAEDWRSELSP